PRHLPRHRRARAGGHARGQPERGGGGMRRELVITNARVVTRGDSFRGSVRAVDDVITDIAPGPSTRAGGLDFDVDLLVPGRVRCRRSGREATRAPRRGVRPPIAGAVPASVAQPAGAGLPPVLDRPAGGYLTEGGERPRAPRPLAEAVRAAKDAGRPRAD